MDRDDGRAGAGAGEPPGWPASGDDADRQRRLEFHAFFEAHHRELARLAYLMLGDRDLADDLAAEALTEVWRRWERVCRSDHPLAYVRRIVLNMCRSRIRSLVRERDRLAVLGTTMHELVDAPDVPVMVDVRAALQALPERKRACLVLRFAFDLSEKETARALGVSVGTVKSQTSKGVAELQLALEGQTAPARRRAAPAPPAPEPRPVTMSTPRTTPAPTAAPRRRRRVAALGGPGGVRVFTNVIRSGERPQGGA